LKDRAKLHLNIAKWHIETIDKIPIDYIAPRIPYRETITKQAKSMYRHKKQSGGAGQFGEVHMLIQPYTEDMQNQPIFRFVAPKSMNCPGVESSYSITVLLVAPLIPVLCLPS
jgi:translation elongation factor EF-G